jgi:hypothetical protein
MIRRNALLGMAAVAALGIAATLIVQRVRAAGIPATGTLTYTGALANPDGTPLTATTKNIGLFTYDAPTTGNMVLDCTVTSGAVSLNAGQFQIALPAACTAKIQATPDLWLEVQVDGTSLGRTKLGSVPYAVEAEHAVTADSATNATHATGADSATNATHATSADSATTADAASGALDTRIAALETRLGAVSAFRAHTNFNQTLPNNVVTPLLFDVVDYDLNHEFTSDASASTFTPKTSGYYLVSCVPIFESGSPGVATGWLAAQINVNAVGIAANGFFGDLWTASRGATAVLHLSAMDQVQCLAIHENTGASRIVRNTSTFEATRLPM